MPTILILRLQELLNRTLGETALLEAVSKLNIDL